MFCCTQLKTTLAGVISEEPIIDVAALLPLATQALPFKTNRDLWKQKERHANLSIVAFKDVASWSMRKQKGSL